MTQENQETSNTLTAKALPSSSGSVQVGGDFYNGVEWLAAWMVDNVEGHEVGEEELREWAAKAWLQHVEKQNV